MARTIPLNNIQIKQTKPDKSKTIKLSDGDGLQLLIKPNGSKIWHLRYLKPATKKQNTLSLGAYPALSLAKAREERKKARVMLANGIDPKKYHDELIYLLSTSKRQPTHKVKELAYMLLLTRR